jgi:hypothetical protein
MYDFKFPPSVGETDRKKIGDLLMKGTLWSVTTSSSLVCIVIVVCSFAAGLCDAQSTTVPQFTSEMCGAWICVGFDPQSVSWWIYRAKSLSDDSTSLEDDNYVIVSPISFNSCNPNCSLIDLQSAQPTTPTANYTTLDWNDTPTLNLNYSLHSSNISISSLFSPSSLSS